MNETNITIIIDEEENENNKNEEENIQENTQLQQQIIEDNNTKINKNDKKYFWKNRRNNPLITVWRPINEWANRGRETIARLAVITQGTKNWSKPRLPKVSRRAENQIRNFGPLLLLLSLFVYLILGASAFLFFEHTNHEIMREIVNLLSLYEQQLELKMPDLNEWTLENSLTYCWGLITTIGHGHRSPKTGGGQVFALLYCVLGVPFFVFTLIVISYRLLNLCRVLSQLVTKNTCDRELERIVFNKIEPLGRY
uniref:Potassium channel domain-containing protein n=1 Tax=Meloidogyne javanica TaxID=6303 RepID=A0A915M0Q9_MELJA